MLNLSFFACVCHFLKIRAHSLPVLVVAKDFFFACDFHEFNSVSC